MAIRFVVLFFKSAFVKLFQTESANEMLRMEFPEHGGDATARDGFVTTGAEGAAFQMIVGLAVRLTFVVKKGASDERLSAILKNKI